MRAGKGEGGNGKVLAVPYISALAGCCCNRVATEVLSLLRRCREIRKSITFSGDSKVKRHSLFSAGLTLPIFLL